MALINRLSRLFTADMHAVLDRLEEPEVLLKHAVREMEDEAAKFTQRLRRLEHEQVELERRVAEISATLDELDEQLNLCFDSGEDALARTVIKRKLAHNALLKTLRARGDALAAELATDRQRQVEQCQRLESVRQKANLVTDELHNTDDAHACAPDIGITDEDVEVALLKEKTRRKRS